MTLPTTFTTAPPLVVTRFSSTLFLLWMPILVNVVFAFFAMQVNGRSGEKVRCAGY